VQIETRQKPPHPADVDVVLPPSGRRRVRTDAGRLTREAERRRRRANAAVVVSLTAVLALVAIFYRLLMR
jgi:hypothetical protein